MKHRFLALLITLLMLLGACTGPAAPSEPDPAPASDYTEIDTYEEPISYEDVDLEEEDTVYITDTGSKYHAEGCQYLSKSCHALYLYQAQDEGYEPCTKCDPPY